MSTLFSGSISEQVNKWRSKNVSVTSAVNFSNKLVNIIIWQVDLIIWQVDLIIWQVELIIWQVDILLLSRLVR